MAGALGWLALYDHICQAHGKVGESYRPLLEEKVRREPPDFLYKFHRQFLASCEAEANA